MLNYMETKNLTLEDIEISHMGLQKMNLMAENDKKVTYNLQTC